MRTILNQLILLIAGLLFVPQISGQTRMSNIDSVAIFVPNMNKNSYKFLARAANISELIDWGGKLYQFFDNGSKEIEYGDLQRKFIQYKADPIAGKIGAGAMTLITGVGFNSIGEGKWEISERIICNDTLPDWNVLMYCQGNIETVRERVRNEDGFNSVETSYKNVYYWDSNATGILIEGNDTIGFFRIIMNPREDSLLKSLSADNLLPRQASKNSNVKISSDLPWMHGCEIDFGITGIFRDKDFFIISDGTKRKTWIFIDNIFMGMFQEYHAISRKYHIPAYLLVNKNIPGPERRDQFRIAIMSRCLNAVLNQP